MSLRAPLLIALALMGGSASLSAQSASNKPAADSAGCCTAKAPAKPDCPMMKGMDMGKKDDGMKMNMPMPTAADEARLDSLVTLMHQGKGEKKVAAMEKVIDELLAHRSAMREHMRHMMEGMEGMDGMGSPAPDHAQHH